MGEQMTLFDFIEPTKADVKNILEGNGAHYCSGCNHAIYKEHSRLAGDIWYCNEMHTMITEKSFDWICQKSRGKSMYERRKK